MTASSWLTRPRAWSPLEAHGVWVHGGPTSQATWASYPQARLVRLAELHRRWDEEHERLRQLVLTLGEQAKVSPAMAAKLVATETRLARYEAAPRPPEQPVEQKVTMRLRGGRTGIRALACESLELSGLMRPLDLAVYYGERVAVLGSNGSGESHFLRLLAGQLVEHTGVVRLGARVVPGRPVFARLARRFIFGTDRPGVPGIARNARAIGGLGLDPDTFAAILGGNARRVYRGSALSDQIVGTECAHDRGRGTPARKRHRWRGAVG